MYTTADFTHPQGTTPLTTLIIKPNRFLTEDDERSLNVQSEG